ncbi:MAG: thioesterase, partial [Bacteroidota bacterium]|nr:thioesterase [Bacteroidota bacterium]
VRLQSLSEEQATVRVPYKWFSQNPFKSTYFACLAMAGEMSTGLLAMMHVYKRNPPVSMLVVKLEAQYFKKATGMTWFTCNDGKAMVDTIEKALATGEGQTITAVTHGLNSAGEKIADFYVTWSFKAKPVQSS